MTGGSPAGPATQWQSPPLSGVRLPPLWWGSPRCLTACTGWAGLQQGRQTRAQALSAGSASSSIARPAGGGRGAWGQCRRLCLRLPRLTANTHTRARVAPCRCTPLPCGAPCRFTQDVKKFPVIFPSGSCWQVTGSEFVPTSVQAMLSACTRRASIMGCRCGWLGVRVKTGTQHTKVGTRPPTCYTAFSSSARSPCGAKHAAAQRHRARRHACQKLIRVQGVHVPARGTPGSPRCSCR